MELPGVGPVVAARTLAEIGPVRGRRARSKAEVAAVKATSSALGNTPAVARGSYVDPRVVGGYESGLTIAAAARRADLATRPDERQAVLERATARLIRRVAKSQ